MSDAGLRAHDLVIGYETPLTEPLNFEVGPGEILVVVGESGCGKSTLLSTLAGVTAALKGEIYSGDRCLNGVPIHKRNIGLVFQDHCSSHTYLCSTILATHFGLVANHEM